MKNLATRVKQEALKFWQDEEAQGMMEYILIAVVVIGIVMAVGPEIKGAIFGKAQKLTTDLEQVNTNLK